jgi:hypothetical protein
MGITRRFIGIDPGKNGALACIWEHTGRVQIWDFDGSYGSHWLPVSYLDDPYDKSETHVVVEDVCGRPGQSVVANTTFMKLAGQAEYIGWYLAADGYFQKVRPQTWKKHFGIIGNKNMSKTEKKKLSIELARKLYPELADMLIASKDGRSEALLMALYGKQKYDEQISKC